MLSIKVGSNDPIYLPVMTEELQHACERWYDAADQEEFVPSDNGLDSFPAPDPIPRPRPKIGLWYFPVFGARRWARGDFLIGKTELDLLRAQLGYGNEVVLKFDDGTSPAVEYQAFVLRARPLSENNDPATDDAWVLTLVDDRYYWQLREGTGGSPPFGSWTALFSAFSGRVGKTITIADPPDVAYLTPTTRWSATTGAPTAWLIDAAAHMIGSRVVFAPDGTPYLQRPTTTNRDAATTFHTANAASRHGGGLIPTEDIADAVPEKFLALFGGNPPPIESVTLSTLLLTLYGAAVGVADSTAWIWVDAPDTTSGAAKTALATRAAKDWYNWQMSPLEAQYGGFVVPPLSGFVGHVEHWHTSDEGETRVVAPPSNYGGEGHANPFTGATAETLLVEVTAYNPATLYHTVKRKTWDGVLPAYVNDYAPLTTYTTCRATTGPTPSLGGNVIPVGTRCVMWPIPDRSGEYWIAPSPDYADGTHPGLVSTKTQFIGGSKQFLAAAKFHDGADFVGDLFANPVGPWLGAPVRINDGVASTYGGTGTWIYSIDAFGNVITRGQIISKGLASGVNVFLDGSWGFAPDGMSFTVPAFASSRVSGAVIWGTPGVPLPYGAFIAGPVGDGLVAGVVQPNTGTTSGLVNSSKFRLATANADSWVTGGAVPGQGAFGFWDLVIDFPRDGVWAKWDNGAIFAGGLYMGGGPVRDPGGRVGTTGVATAKTGEVFLTDDTGVRTVVYLDPNMIPGDRFEVVGRASGGWELAQRTGQQVHGFDGADALTATTVGTAGKVRGPQYSAAEFMCIDTNVFTLVRRVGPLTWI